MNNKKDRISLWMMISGATGFTFFLIANFTALFDSLNVLAGCMQLAVNAFVFYTWTKAFVKSSGFKKFFAFFGVGMPIIMAGITIFRVFIPFFF